MSEEHKPQDGAAQDAPRPEDAMEAARDGLESGTLERSEPDQESAADAHDGEDAAPEGEEPAEHRIFGMPAVMFRSIAVGFAVGMIVAGLLRLKSAYLPVIICAGLGWLVGKLLEKRAKAQP